MVADDSAQEADHYQVLGLEPTATPQQIERAYRFYEEMYGEDSLATYSLIDAGEAERTRERLDAAYATLIDPDARHAYDVACGHASAREPLLRFEPRTTPVPAPLRQPPTLLADPVTGADLRRFREERGIELRQIAEASKVGLRFLEYIEQDRHALLPAEVYLRGFLREYARAVGLDPGRTAESYLKAR